MAIDQLDTLDWETLTGIRNFLKNFYDATKSTEGRNAIIDSVLPAMDFLLELFEQGAEEFRHDTYMSLCIDAGWKKLVQYYKKADRLPSYIAAIVLNPTKKWSYFEDWEPEWRFSAKQSLKSFWESTYRSSTGNVQRVQDTNDQTTSNNAYLSWIAKKQAQPLENVEELQQYVSEPRLMHTGPVISWWMDTAQLTRFPVLSTMALDIFSIPAMSSEAERVFSGTKHTISDERASLHMTTIEALECLKSSRSIIQEIA